MTATVTASSGSGIPTGTVTFDLGSTMLGSATLSGTGGTAQATLVVSGSQLSLGSNTITANYSGAANYYSSFAPVIVTVAQSTVTASSYTISTVAGNGTSGSSGDGGLATLAELDYPTGVAVDGAGNLFIADTFNARIRKVTPAGAISTVAGNGTRGFSGDGGPATSAELRLPSGIAFDSAGNLFIADETNNRIRKVTAAGTISTVAGNGTAGFSGDGGPAAAAELFEPEGVAVDSAGNLYIADSINNRIRKVTAAGTISTVAGNGTQGFSGDGGRAVLAELNQPSGIAVDSAGNLFIADLVNGVIREVTAAGTISTVAGNGMCCFDGDGGLATSAELFEPWDVAVDAAGNLFIVDSGNYRIRRVTPAGMIGTVAGNGTPGFSGDGGPATSAELRGPQYVALDGTGNVFFSDTNNERIGKLTPASPQPSLTVSKTHSGSFSQGQTGATYTVTAGNAASSAPTSGAVTVTENPPTGLTVVSMTGSGWTCTTSTCTRSDVLSAGASYPAIAVTVNVASTAPSQVTNQVTVSGGGSTSATASDLTTIVPTTVAISTTTTVVANPASILTTGSTTLTATVAAGSGSGTPTGTVSFTLGTAVLNLAPLAGTGGTAQATLIVYGSQLSVGSNTITANYSGDANFQGSSAPVTVTVASSSSPIVTGVENDASFQAGFASATWVAILGSNLSQTTRTWQGSDFVNGLLPTSLSGVSVTINGVPAYVEYISPTQVNVLAPDDATVGAVQVQVTTAQVASNSFTAQKQPVSPGIFLFAGNYVVAQHADYSLVGKSGLIAGATTTPAAPGETVVIWATGFGPSSPPLPTGQEVTTPALLADSVTFTIGGVAAPVAYAALVGSGLYQFNVTVPNVPNGDAIVAAQIAGVQSQTGALITVQSPIAAPAAPQITSVSPASGQRGSSVSLVISGANLSGVTAVQFSPSTGIAVTNVNATASQVTATVTIAASAPAGQASVSVSVWPSAGISNALTFTTLASGPQIASLSPASATPGSTVSLSIAGSNLSGVTGIQFSPSANITVTGIGASASQVSATVAIDATAAAGTRSVSVTGPGGTSNALTFTIQSNPPQISSLSPSSATAGQTVNLVISGTNLGGTTGIQFSPSANITVTGIGASASQVSATVAIDAAAAAGTRSVSVTGPGGTSNALTFTIQSNPPQISSLSPSSATAGQSITLAIGGTNLGGVTAIQFSPSANITVTGIGASASQVSATVAIGAAAAAGTRSVAVIGPGGTSNALTFTILSNAPQISSLSPASATAGQTFTSAIGGTNLGGVTGIQFSPSANITVSGIGASASLVSATVAIDAAAAVGSRTVTVTGPGGTSNALSFNILQSGGNYSGNWSGTTNQGLGVAFTVANNAIAPGYSYSIDFPNLGSSCPTGATTTGEMSIPISGNSFSGSSFSGTFNSTTAASGTINWNLSIPGCSASGTLTWTATKQ